MKTSVQQLGSEAVLSLNALLVVDIWHGSGTVFMHFKLLSLQLQFRGNIISEPYWVRAFQYSEVNLRNLKQASYPLNLATANYVEINSTISYFYTIVQTYYT